MDARRSPSIFAPPTPTNTPKKRVERPITKIRDLLALHDAHAHRTPLSDYLGDGYMFSTNRVVRNVRARVTAMGFRFSSSEMSECQAWPLMGLRYMMERKVVPYDDTVTLLRHIEADNPGRFTLNDLATISRPNRSPILHESSHALFERILEERRAAEGARAPRTAKARLFEALLGESFTGTCETFASYFGAAGVQTFLLNYYHSQVPAKVHVREALDRTIDTFGLESAVEIQTLAFLHYNFMYKRILRRHLGATLDVLGIAVKPKAADWAALGVLFQHALAMNPTARVYTAFNYQYFMRISPARTALEYLEAVDFDFIPWVARPEYRTSLAEAARLLVAP